MSHLYPPDHPDTVYPKDVKVGFHVVTPGDLQDRTFFERLYATYAFGFPKDARDPRFFHDITRSQAEKAAALEEVREHYEIIGAFIGHDLVGVAATTILMAPRKRWGDPEHVAVGMDYRSVLPRARKRRVAEKFAEFAAERARGHAAKIGLVSHPDEAGILGFNEMARPMQTPFGAFHADYYLAEQNGIKRVGTWNNQGYLRVAPNDGIDFYYEPESAIYGEQGCDYYSKNFRLGPGRRLLTSTFIDMEDRSASLRRMNGGDPRMEPTGQYAFMADQVSKLENLQPVRDYEALEPFLPYAQILLERYPVRKPVKENYPGSLPDDIAREKLGTLLSREFGLKIPVHL
jgi:hypothetical protein